MIVYLDTMDIHIGNSNFWIQNGCLRMVGKNVWKRTRTRLVAEMCVALLRVGIIKIYYVLAWEIHDVFCNEHSCFAMNKSASCLFVFLLQATLFFSSWTPWWLFSSSLCLCLASNWRLYCRCGRSLVLVDEVVGSNRWRKRAGSSSGESGLLPEFSLVKLDRSMKLFALWHN